MSDRPSNHRLHLRLTLMALACVALPAVPLTQGWTATGTYKVAFGAHTTPTQTYAGTVYTCEVAARNTGSASWYPTGAGRVALAYHWRSGSGRELVRSSWRAFPDATVPPSGDTTFTARMRAPVLAGDYVLRWDVVRPGVGWFSSWGAAVLDVPVHNQSDFAAEYRSYDGPPAVYAYTAYDSTLTIANTSRMTWLSNTANPVGVTYRWTSGGETVPARAISSYFRETAPGEVATVAARLVGPSSDGTGVVRWDLFQAGVARFSNRGVATLDVTYPVRFDYRAQYRPSGVPAEMFGGSTYRVSVLVKNSSRMAWPKGRSVVLKVHWAKSTGEYVSTTQVSTLMPRYIAPGRSVRLACAVYAPKRRGTYVLHIELYHRGRCWFSKSGSPSWHKSVRLKRLTQLVYYHGDRSRKEIALTFDDGYGFDHRILSTTERYNVPATAFLIGGVVGRLKPEIRRMKAHGWEICNHTWTHRSITGLSDSQLRGEVNKTAAALDPVVGRRYPFFRPPYGAMNAHDIALINSMGYRVIIWDVDPRDWSSARSPSQKLATILSQTRPGSIILLHFGGKGTAEILPRVISTLKGRGYRFKRLSEILY